MSENIKIKRDVPLAPLSTFGIGGKAKRFAEISSENGLCMAINKAGAEGLGFKICADASNVVFPDDTLESLLIRIKGGSIKRVGEEKIMVDAGTKLMDLVSFANEQGLEGLETLAGIPGTVGGAIAGNAGAYGRSISDTVKRVKVLEVSDSRQQKSQSMFWITNEECGFDYRESSFKKYPIIATKAKFWLKKGDPEKLKKKSEEIIKTREAKYKPGLKCPGSFFKNVLVKDVDKDSLRKINKEKIIEGKVPSGYLLEKVGAKGMRQGNVRIADFHANLFINEGGGTASDVKKLAKTLKDKVEKEFDIKLEEEVRYF